MLWENFWKEVEKIWFIFNIAVHFTCIIAVLLLKGIIKYNILSFRYVVLSICNICNFDNLEESDQQLIKKLDEVLINLTDRFNYR